MYVITSIHLDFPITIISPWGGGSRCLIPKWFMGLPQGPRTATLSEGWMTSDPGRRWPSTERVCATYDLFRYIWQLPIFSGDSRVYVQQKSMKIMSHVWSHWNYPSMACWIVLFPSKEYPRIRICTCFTLHNYAQLIYIYILYIYIFN